MKKTNRKDILYQKVDESDYKIWYVSSEGDVFSIRKSDKVRSELSKHLNHRNQVTVRIKGKTYVLKNLIARSFLRIPSKKMIILLKDKNPFHVSIDNIICVPEHIFMRKLQNDRVCRPVVQIVDGEIVNQWKSVKSAAEYFNYDKSSLSRILKKEDNHLHLSYVS